ncbi:MAG: hypothetical protein Ct9H300mP16_05620 [Pseudomonadota bacterium]|nr:MAG: hypothetical protein Ct9H300mP16_05620 [Pseudomonadota bacterium]
MPNAARAFAAMADYRAFRESSVTQTDGLPAEESGLTGHPLNLPLYHEYEPSSISIAGVSAAR